MKYRRENMAVIPLVVFSELLVGMNTAPMTGDEQTLSTTAIGVEEEGSNKYTAVEQGVKWEQIQRTRLTVRWTQTTRAWDKDSGCTRVRVGHQHIRWHWNTPRHYTTETKIMLCACDCHMCQAKYLNMSADPTHADGDLS